MAKPVAVKYPNLPDGFRERCKEVRLKKGITQAQMARDLGVLAPQISQLENGQRNFSYETAMQWKKYLGFRFALPKPILSEGTELRRVRPIHPIEKERFKVVIDGEIFEVLTYRRLGKVKTGTRKEN